MYQMYIHLIPIHTHLIDAATQQSADLLLYLFVHSAALPALICRAFIVVIVIHVIIVAILVVIIAPVVLILVAIPLLVIPVLHVGVIDIIRVVGLVVILVIVVLVITIVLPSWLGVGVIVSISFPSALFVHAMKFFANHLFVVD
jgi:hypothetical protein